jgi:RepB DNA-primase from phage plasmid
MNQHFKPPALKPDLGQAAEFINRLTGKPNSVVCFQVFPEAPGADGFPWHEHGTLQQMSQKLILAQRRGCGVFIVVNQTDGAGRRATNIKYALSAFVDLDKTELPSSFSLKPHMVVQSSPGRHHVYWLCETAADVQLISVMQKRLATYYGGDTKVCDPSHVMRLPGFWHLKAEPVLVRIIESAVRMMRRSTALAGICSKNSRSITLVSLTPRPPLLTRSVSIPRRAAGTPTPTFVVRFGFLKTRLDLP